MVNNTQRGMEMKCASCKNKAEYKGSRCGLPIYRCGKCILDLFVEIGEYEKLK